MEFLAFQKAFTFLLGTGMIIKSFISDRHTSIAKWMREDCAAKCTELGKPVVKHFFDLWHIAKSKHSFYWINDHMPVNRKKNVSLIIHLLWTVWLLLVNFSCSLWTYNKKNFFVLESYGWTFSFLNKANNKSETCWEYSYVCFKSKLNSG